MAQSTGLSKRRATARDTSSALYRNRRQEIARAAARVFDRRGYKGTTLMAIAAELQMDRATLYYYIASKDELFDEITRTVVEENALQAERIAKSQVSPRAKLEAFILFVMGSYAQNYPLLYIYIREDLTHVSAKRSRWSADMRRLNRVFDKALLEIIEEGYAEGSFRKLGSSVVVANGILGLMGWTNRWFNPKTSAVDAQEIARTYAELVIAGIGDNSRSLLPVKRRMKAII